MPETCTPGDLLHHDDGSHRTTPPYASGRKIWQHETALRRHLNRIAAAVCNCPRSDTLAPHLPGCPVPHRDA